MTRKDVVATYLEHLRSCRYSANTLEICERWLLRLTAHCHEAGLATPAAAGIEHLDAFHQSLLWRPVTEGPLYMPCTIDQALRVVRSFFRWAVAAEVALVDPTRHWVLRRVPRPLPHLLTVAEVEKLLAMPDMSKPGGLRDRMVLETLYATGLRRMECRNLDIDDVELAGCMVRVRAGKGGKDRWVPMGSQLAATMGRYLDEGRPLLAQDDTEPALLLARTGTRLSTIRMNQIVAMAGRQAGLRVSPHGLRHAYATHLLEAGADLLHLQQLLGHAHLGSTQIYAHVHPLELSKVHRKTHPRA